MSHYKTNERSEQEKAEQSERNRLVTVKLTVVHETPKAFLVFEPDDGITEADALKVWVPKSQLTGVGHVSKGDDMEVQLPKWLADEKGFMYR